MSDKHHRYYKHTKFCQNPRGDPKFLVDLTWNDPNDPLAPNYISTIYPQVKSSAKQKLENSASVFK